MFSDHVTLTLSSGKGGAGAVSFRREKHVIMGGPDGGDGGRGGDVFFLVDNNSHTLSSFKGKNHLKAQNGRPGEGRNKYGKKGESLVVVVPPGTQVIDEESGEVLLDLVKEGEKVKFLEGGLGGLGNSHFKGPTNQRPSYAQPGRPGESKKVKLELKLIADVGLVGFPNVGKSTLISTISNARPEIANYEFTTLTPKLGLVNVGEYNSFIMADIPGIIGGARDGKGLGLQFLKHIQRTRILLFMLDLAHYESLQTQYETLRVELEKFSTELYGRNFAIALTRYDAGVKEEVDEKIEEFLNFLKLPSKSAKFGSDGDKKAYFADDEFEKPKKDEPLFVLPISSATNANLEALKFALNEAITKELS